VKAPVWVLRETVLSLHERLQAEFGGLQGVREERFLDAVLARPERLFAAERPTIFDLAACHAHGFMKDRPCVDGNKRTGFAVAALFLELNGYRLVASPEEARIHGLAASNLRESDYAAWMKGRTRRI
jgi:death-on-curing protein